VSGDEGAVRAIECPQCGLLLRLPEQHDGQPVFCPGCRSRFVIEVEGTGWQPRLLDEPSEPAAAQGIKPVRPAEQPLAAPDPLDNADVAGEEESEEDQETPDVVPMVGRKIVSDVDDTRTRIVHIAFLIGFVPVTLIAVLACLSDGMFLGAIFLAPLIGLTAGVFAAILVGVFLAPGEKGRRPAGEVMEYRLEEQRQKRQGGELVPPDPIEPPPDEEGPAEAITEQRKP
jgi:uncharacterized Zn finger protein (UPF0148 family)